MYNITLHYAKDIFYVCTIFIYDFKLDFMNHLHFTLYFVIEDKGCVILLIRFRS